MPAMPWWARAPARIATLLALLIAVGLYGVPRLLDRASGGAPSVCASQHAPRSAQLPPASVERLAADAGLDALAAAGTPDVRGLQQTSAAWSDTPPVVAGSTPRVDAGYEVRWWSRRYDHQAADVFVFWSAAAAAAYVSEAASSRCRGNGLSYPLDQPRGARALVWSNPLGGLQADVFFARGDRAYRIVEVPPGTNGQTPFDVDLPPLVDIPQRLACGLAAAACTANP